jgi:amino-acid N-acetyltransferase
MLCSGAWSGRGSRVLRFPSGLDPGAVTMTTAIEAAGPADLDAISRLLAENGLPLAGFREHLANTLVAREDGRIVGSAALEVYADGVLLRSVAVRPERHGQQLGHALTRAAIQRARALGANAIYLLTTTAERFFPRFGFEAIGRTDVPPGVQTSVEFTSACPSTATVMRKIL